MAANDQYFRLMEQNIEVVRTDMKTVRAEVNDVRTDMNDGFTRVMGKLEGLDEKFVRKEEYEKLERRMEENEKRYEKLNSVYLAAGGILVLIAFLSPSFMPPLWKAAARLFSGS